MGKAQPRRVPEPRLEPQSQQKGVLGKTRDYTPQMTRAHVPQPAVSLHSPGRNNLYLSQMPLHEEHADNMLTQTLSPHGLQLRLHGEQTQAKEPIVEPQSTQHQRTATRGERHKANFEGPHSKANSGGVKKQSFGYQHVDNKTIAQKQPRYQAQTKKTTSYESVTEQQNRAFLSKPSKPHC